ncbi:hypothetical protein B0H13DRAFT_1877967 [Mycena leptocephala]|nr:hypothetical protein B0H13DRAFT_1877967 [Mycena leptocephala]
MLPREETAHPTVPLSPQLYQSVKRKKMRQESGSIWIGPTNPISRWKVAPGAEDAIGKRCRISLAAAFYFGFTVVLGSHSRLRQRKLRREWIHSGTYLPGPIDVTVRLCFGDRKGLHLPRKETFTWPIANERGPTISRYGSSRPARWCYI